MRWEINNEQYKGVRSLVGNKGLRIGVMTTRRFSLLFYIYPFLISLPQEWKAETAQEMQKSEI